MPWNVRWLKCRDFWVPADRADARAALEEAFNGGRDRACRSGAAPRSGPHGNGAGLPGRAGRHAPETTQWRSCGRSTSRAVEMPWQRRYVRTFDPPTPPALTTVPPGVRAHWCCDLPVMASVPTGSTGDTCRAELSVVSTERRPAGLPAVAIRTCGHRGGRRPNPRRWGLGDVGYGLIVAIGAQTVVGVMLVVLRVTGSGDLDLPTWGILLSVAAGWLGFIGWPVLASSVKGHAVWPCDLGLRFRPDPTSAGVSSAGPSVLDTVAMLRAQSLLGPSSRRLRPGQLPLPARISVIAHWARPACGRRRDHADRRGKLFRSIASFAREALQHHHCDRRARLWFSAHCRTDASTLRQLAVQGLFIAVVIHRLRARVRHAGCVHGATCALDHRSYGHQRHWCGELSGHVTNKRARQLTPWFLFAEALGTFRRRWKRVIGVGVTVTVSASGVAPRLDVRGRAAQNNRNEQSPSRWRPWR